MSGCFNARGELDLADGRIITIIGTKSSGKSVLGLMLLRSYPGDRVVVDVAGDDGPQGPGVTVLHGTVQDLPKRWPEHLRRRGPAGEWRPMTLKYRPDMGSETSQEDVDAIVGLTLRHGNEERHAGRIGCCLLIHEVGIVAKANRTPPHMRRLLNANRHHAVTAILCGPRPLDIDPLVMGNADLVYLFDTRNPADVQRAAAITGMNPADTRRAMDDLGPFEYLRADNREKTNPDLRVVHFKALPRDVVRATLAPMPA